MEVSCVGARVGRVFGGTRVVLTFAMCSLQVECCVRGTQATDAEASEILDVGSDCASTLQVDAGIAHVLDDVIPALEHAPGLTGVWLADRAKGKRLSIMVWQSEAAASAAMAEVQKRIAASKLRADPNPVSESLCSCVDR